MDLRLSMCLVIGTALKIIGTTLKIIGTFRSPPIFFFVFLHARDPAWRPTHAAAKTPRGRRKNYRNHPENYRNNASSYRNIIFLYRCKGLGRKPYDPVSMLKAQLLRHLLRVPGSLIFKIPFG